MLDRLDDMREDLNHNDFADEVVGAKKAMDLVPISRQSPFQTKKFSDKFV
jgi:hypothetical protein